MTTSTSRCLGLTLGIREVGIAVTTRTSVLQTRVLNLRCLTSRGGIERRFRQELENTVNAFAVEHIALAAVGTGAEKFPLLVVLHRHVLDVAEEQRLAIAHLAPAAIKSGLAPPATNPSHRALRAAMIARFPSLSHLSSARAAPAINGMRDFGLVNPSAKERYWTPMFLALGAATLHLDQLRL